MTKDDTRQLRDGCLRSLCLHNWEEDGRIVGCCLLFFSPLTSVEFDGGYDLGELRVVVAPTSVCAHIYLGWGTLLWETDCSRKRERSKGPSEGRSLRQLPCARWTLSYTN